MILRYECFGCTLVLFWQWICSFLLTYTNIRQFAIHHNKVEYTLLATMLHMNMYRLMFIRVEVEDESKVFEYLRHSFRFNDSAAKIGIIFQSCKEISEKCISCRQLNLMRKFFVANEVSLKNNRYLCNPKNEYEHEEIFINSSDGGCGGARNGTTDEVFRQRNHHAKGFEVVGVSFDNKKEAWVKGVEQLKLPWLQISDLKGWQCAAASIYKIDGIPDNILIDPQGKITDRALRGKELQSRLQEIFGE